MVDINAISIGLQSIKTALDITKELRGIDSLLKDAEVKLKLANLVEALSDAKIHLSEAKVENQELKERILELESKLQSKQEVEFREGFYYAKNAETGAASGPFCALCYSDSNKLILVSELPVGMRDFGNFRCPKCGTVKS